MQPDSLFERFAYRKANGVAVGRDFLAIKGAQGQLEHSSHGKIEVRNPVIRFKAIGYSVAESSGNIILTIQKGEESAGQEITVGVRTVEGEGTAEPEVNFKPIDDIITIKSSEEEIQVKVPIVDN